MVVRSRGQWRFEHTPLEFAGEPFLIYHFHASFIGHALRDSGLERFSVADQHDSLCLTQPRAQGLSSDVHAVGIAHNRRVSKAAALISQKHYNRME